MCLSNYIYLPKLVYIGGPITVYFFEQNKVCCGPIPRAPLPILLIIAFAVVFFALTIFTFYRIFGNIHEFIPPRRLLQPIVLWQRRRRRRRLRWCNLRRPCRTARCIAVTVKSRQPYSDGVAAPATVANRIHGSRLGLRTGHVQRPAKLQRSTMSGGGQGGSAHPKAALLSGRWMGMDRRGCILHGTRAQPRVAHVFRCLASDYRSQLSALHLRIFRYHM